MLLNANVYVCECVYVRVLITTEGKRRSSDVTRERMERSTVISRSRTLRRNNQRKSMRNTPGETQTFFLLKFLKRSHDSSPVTRFFRNGPCSFRSNKSVKIRTRLALLLSMSSWGTHPANFHTFPSFLRRRTMVEWSTLKLSASIRIVKRSSSSAAAKSAWSSKSDGRPLPGLSFKLVSSDLKRANHSLHRLSLIVPSPKVR